MTDKTPVTTMGISTRSKLAIVTIISATVLGTVYYNKLRRGKKASEIDPKDKLIDDNSLYNDFVASLPDSFTLIDNSTDSFISKIFNSPLSSMIPTSFEELKEQMSALYPNFENQLETIRDMYKNFWDFLSLEEFKDIVRESLKEDDDPKLHPEINDDAHVREGQELSEDEIRFIQLRKKKMKAAFAFFIGVDENEIEVEDIPNIGIASSGGGYRAMVGCSGYLHAMIETGILDCVLYMAGVSGSTWAMSQFYSPLSDGSSKLLKDHLCSRIHTHIANLSNFLTVLNASRHNSKIILHGIIQRYYQQQGTINLVDIFGMLLGGTLLARTLTIAAAPDQQETDYTAGNKFSGLAEQQERPKQVDKTKTVQEDDGSVVKPKLLHRSEIKLSKQRAYFEDGALPMPIYCAVRHEIGIPSTAKANTISNQENIEPCEEVKVENLDEDTENVDTKDREEEDKEKKEDDKDEGEGEEEGEEDNAEDKEEDNVEDDMKDLYQWFEFTPYDMGSEEINAWIPIWSFGRKFEEGTNTEKLPEQSLGILMGMFGSAFVASLAHFYQEIRMILPSSAVEKADEMINSYRSSVSTIHPISPASFPNPFYKMTPKVQTKNEDEDVEEILRTENLVNSEQIGLMDAGMDNNIPFYPLLRKGRDVDIILSIDLSADIQDAPYFDRAEGYVKRRGIKGWPTGAGWPKPNQEEEDKKDSIPTKVDYQQKAKAADNDDKKHKSKYALDTCTVFASSSSETTPADGKNTTTYPENVNPITLVYFPLIVNANYDPEFDPQTAEFCSTWNFVYSTDQVNKLHGLAEANVKDNLEKVRKVFKETWKRKRDERLKKQDLTNI